MAEEMSDPQAEVATQEMRVEEAEALAAKDADKAAPSESSTSNDSGGSGSPSDDKKADATPDASAQPKKKGSSSGLVVGVLAFLAALGLGFYGGQLFKTGDLFGPDTQLETGDRYKVALNGDEPQMGPDTALVTIIEFADYQCPYCLKANGPLKAAVASYDEDVRLIYKHFPLPGHGKALPGAKLAWAANAQGKFWEMHAGLFETGSDIEKGFVLAKELGLDIDKLKADMSSPAAGKAVNADVLAGSKVGVRGTPAFFVNGHLYSGARGEGAWEDIIEAELAAAKALVDAGTPRDGVYDKLMVDALEKAVPSKGAAKGPLDPSVSYRVPADGRPQLGPDDALVTIVMFSDFQCPYCVRLAPIARELTEAHPDVRVVFRQLPLASHSRARDAALATLAADRQGKFWQMHDKLFASQAEIALADFATYAAELGLDVERYTADVADKALERRLLADTALARRFKVNGTPASFVNGRFLRGAQPRGVFEQLIDEERVKAQKLVDAGTPRAEVFDAIMKAAKAKVK